MTHAFILDGVRSAVGNIGGSSARCVPTTSPRTSSRRCSRGIRRSIAARVADVVLGCANQAGEDNRNVARMALLLAGLPVTRPGRDGESALRLAG